ncbi:MAG: hypothetical protein IJD22_01805 [Clostridia bacterium]|nr:hypothetical protein [Clostridia bacterium]
MGAIAFLMLAVICCPYPVEMLLAVSLHEAGHVLSSLILCKRLPTLSLSGAGLRLCCHGPHTTAAAIAISLSGSAFGIAAAILPILPKGFRLASLGLSLMNLLPISGLDGGGALLIFLETLMLPDRAFRISRAVSAFAVLLFWVFAVAVQLKALPNLTLLAVSTYLTLSSLTDS